MLEFLDSIDVEQPFFYLQPCTRCLKCGKSLMPANLRDGRNFWRCNTWRCDEKANVGLGAKNQVTKRIVWSERHEQAGLHGTSLDFVGVEPQLITYGINDGHSGWVDDDGTGFQPDSDPFIEWYELPLPMPVIDEGFTSLIAAILHFRKHWKPNDIRVSSAPWCFSGQLLSSFHDLMEALLSDPLSKEFQTANVNRTSR